MSEAEKTSRDFISHEVQRIFTLQQSHARAVGQSTATERRQKLGRLLDALMDHRQAVRDALFTDFGKHPSEVDLTEIYAVTGEIKHARKHLRRWMRPERVPVPMSQLGSRSWIHYESKGTALIISPWNFPINLTLGPLVSAVAAGNTVIVKPSEFAPQAAAVMGAMIEEVFAEHEVALIEGEVETSTALLALPFNHIFFTGSPAVGKVVMAAAARHLASVTLELGGKSPIIIDETADIDAAATRVTWAKYLNNGQICVAPDYVYVHRSKVDEFLARMQEKLRAFYGDDPRQSPAYGRVVNEKQYDRLRGILEDALQRKAAIRYGGQTRDEDCYIAPTILTNVPPDARIMQEEVFGPLLPVLAYSDLDEPIEAIESRPPPLAFYIYSRDRHNVNRMIRETRAGGTCINHSGLHFFNNNLPFGGLNHSGIGRSHGRFGYQAFSNARGVYQQWLPWSPIDLMMPPYSIFKQKLIDLTIRWF